MNFSKLEQLQMNLSAAMTMEQLKAFDYEKAEQAFELATNQQTHAKNIVKGLRQAITDLKRERDKT